MKYRYVAMDTNGKKEKGIIDAENETAVIYHLRNQDLSPISVSPYKEKAEHFWEVEIMEPDVHKLKMKKKDLIALSGISRSTVAKLTHDENVNTDVLARICKALQCDVGDIMEMLPDEE